MLASLLRPKKRPSPERPPFSSPYAPRETTPLNQDYPQQSRYGGFNGRGNRFRDNDIIEEEFENGDNDQEGEVDDEDEAHESSPLLPIFSASHLGMKNDFCCN